MQKSKAILRWMFKTNPVSKAYAAQMEKLVCVYVCRRMCVPLQYEVKGVSSAP